MLKFANLIVNYKGNFKIKKMKYFKSILIFGLFINLANAQKDSIYNRYTDKFRLESFSMIPTYVGFRDETDKDIFNWNGNFSYGKHLIEIGHLEIDFKNDRSQNGNMDDYTKNTYNLFHISYGYASIFNEKWRMHHTFGLGQIRIEKDRNGLILQDSRTLNLRLGSTLFYDIGKQFASGIALGYNWNTLKPIPEVGLAFTYKPFTKAELDVIRRDRYQKMKSRDSLRNLNLVLGKENNFRFHSVQTEIGHGNSKYRSKTYEELIEEGANESFSGMYIGASVIARWNNQLFGFAGSTTVRWALFYSPANFTEGSLLYGRLFKIIPGVEIEAYSGISVASVSNIGGQQFNDLTKLGVPIKLNLVMLDGRNRFGLTTNANFNTLVTNYSFGVHYNRRF